MRVALVSFHFGEYCIRLASGLAQDPDTSVLLFLPDHEVERYRHLLSDSVELRTFKNARLRDPFAQFLMVTRLMRQIKKFNPCVVHLQIGHFWFNLALPFLGDIPLVFTVHDAVIHVGDVPSAKTPQWVWDRACYRARERIVLTQQVKDLLLQRLQIPSRTVHVVPSVLIGDNSQGETNQEEGERILFFGRIWEYKGLEYLIRAEPTITAKVPRAKIVIAGTGEDFERYRRMMVHPENFIVYNEYVSDEKRAELFGRASVVVLPYIEASQSWIISIAYRFGKPVVATTVGGLPEMIEHGRTGFLVRPATPTLLRKRSFPCCKTKSFEGNLEKMADERSMSSVLPNLWGRKRGPSIARR